MTREDAIKIIKNEEDCVLTDCYRPSCESCNLVMETYDILTALDMAIEALEQEPCDDAVSREAAIDAALSAFSRGLLASPDIRKLPSVQPEIIHCRDCKHSMNNENGEPWICAHPNNNAWNITPDHYCGYAERREDQDG